MGRIKTYDVACIYCAYIESAIAGSFYYCSPADCFLKFEVLWSAVANHAFRFTER
jgi:hypothetical protein